MMNHFHLSSSVYFVIIKKCNTIIANEVNDHEHDLIQNMNMDQHEIWQINVW